MNAKLDKLEATLDARYYTRENVDDKLKEVQAKHDALKAEMDRHEQSWQNLGARWAAWGGLIYIILNIAHSAKLW